MNAFCLHLFLPVWSAKTPIGTPWLTTRGCEIFSFQLIASHYLTLFFLSFGLWPHTSGRYRSSGISFLYLQLGKKKKRRRKKKNTGSVWSNLYFPIHFIVIFIFSIYAENKNDNINMFWNLYLFLRHNLIWMYKITKFNSYSQVEKNRDKKHCSLENDNEIQGNN